MKKLIILAFCAITIIGELQAQSLEVTAFSGYTFQNKFPITGGEARFDDGHTYGVILTKPLGSNNALEIFYSRQDTRVDVRSIYFNESPKIFQDASINYIMIGGSKIVPAADEALQGYGGLRIGAAILASSDDSYSSLTEFAAGATVGMKYFFNDFLGIRLAANLNFPITNVGGTLGWSSSGGAYVGVDSWSPLVQFALTGGLTIRLGQ